MTSFSSHSRKEVAAFCFTMTLLATSFSASAANLKVIYTFTSPYNDGAFPVDSLVTIDGTLYGSTRGGGIGFGGTVFRVTTKGAEAVLCRFPDVGPGAGVTNVDGILYGTTTSSASEDGTIFECTTAGVETALYTFQGPPDGDDPQTSLINVGGTLYGTTSYGGANNYFGTVFKTTTAGVETVLYSFKGGSDGAYPGARLTKMGGALYGTTTNGGTNDDGVVFKVTKAGVETVLYSFMGGSDGANPQAALTNLGGALYGTTTSGGESNEGTVFKVTTAGAETVLYSFKGGSDGATPEAGLINVDGTLYGTTAGGGAYTCEIFGNEVGCGTIYSVTPAGQETVLDSFQGGSNGELPEGGLIDLRGKLYGTTYLGGAATAKHCPYGCGTVFEVTR